MADEAKEEEAEAQDAEGSEAADASPAPKKRLVLNRKVVMMLAIPALLLFAGGSYFAVSASGLMGTSGPVKATAKQKLYFDLPEMVVNLSSPDKHVQYLKLKVALETTDRQTLNALDPVMPRILDAFQLYLRELRSSDLEGSAGIFRLKEELLRRINLEIHPNEVNRVLFKEIIVQ